MRVFKYRGGNDEIFTRDLISISNDSFWSPTRDHLNDPCEGLVSSSTLNTALDSLNHVFSKNNNLNDAFSDVKTSLHEILNKKDSCGIYSLSKTCTDELLWAHYADSHRGFCIEYDLDTLIYFGGADYYSFDVDYKDYIPELSFEGMSSLSQDSSYLLRKMLGVKSSRWAYEEEIRVVTSFSGLNSYDYRAVKAIHFGVRMPVEKIRQVMEKLKGRSIDYYQMELKNNSYNLIKRPLEDKFPTKEKYKYKIAPIAELAVDSSYLSSEWVEYEPYLAKVAEIVRREPYCDELMMVEVSKDKSKPGQPVFFGQFQRAKFRYENIYFTPEEIDEKYSKIKDLS